MIRNPVLPGFHPDPSILRVGDDYFIANSTFEWFPGVPIYHSKDLEHWKLVSHALTRRSQLNLDGVADSAGVWAPSLSYADGRFYLIYTIVRTIDPPVKDLRNYLITAPNITGPWSEPIYLNSSGFDASLFHDDDGSKWLATMQWDFRKGRPRFAGIVLQEYDAEHRSLVGPARTILTKPPLLEGPNLYKLNGWYYLMLAEGGTGWNHGISMARSRVLTGPYELDPQPLVLTSRKNPALPLQKAGHGELVQTPASEWYLVHLCSRPIYPERRCTLGRETALQRVIWTADGWLRLESGGTDPQVEVASPQGVSRSPWPAPPKRDDFTSSPLDPAFCSLRVPVDASWLTLDERPGWLRLRGRDSLYSRFDQSLVAKRLETFGCIAQTCMEFEPTHFSQMAGMICWYDRGTHYYLRVTHDEVRGKMLGIILSDDGTYDELLDSQIAINDWRQCHLRTVIKEERLDFFASPDGRDWRKIGPTLDASKLSDDYGRSLRFTGAFIGLCAQDLNSAKATADFDYLEMIPTNLENQPGSK
jgi:xylan 1,4-beta-xylosidase